MFTLLMMCAEFVDKKLDIRANIQVCFHVDLGQVTEFLVQTAWDFITSSKILPFGKSMRVVIKPLSTVYMFPKKG